MLSHLRKGEYEGLENRLNGGETSHSDATRWPDAGAKEWSDVVARTGGITVGARSILVAYNVNVDEEGASVSKKIGSIVRSSGRLLKSPNGGKIRSRGMLPKVQGMGVPVDELVDEVRRRLEREDERGPLDVLHVLLEPRVLLAPLVDGRERDRAEPLRLGRLAFVRRGARSRCRSSRSRVAIYASTGMERGDRRGGSSRHA